MQHEQAYTRREALNLGMAGGFAMAFAGDSPRRGQPAAHPKVRQRPENIIWMVSDGMSQGVISLAEPFSRLVRRRGTHWYRLLSETPDAAHGLFETYALNTMVTDSAAASTAWASGSRVINGALNVLPDGTELTPVGRLARDAGRRIGLVTTTTITHATPAGFVAIHPNRDAEPAIAAQYLDRVDVLLGGGRPFFAANRRSDGEDLFKRYRAHGYAVVQDRSALLANQGSRRVLGTFADGHLPYTIDRRNEPAIAERVPTLVEMTRAALSALRDAPNGFLLQVEGGRIDHAAHANDAAGLLWDQLAFDDALGEVLAFAAREPDTLVVVTSDHGNANPGLNGMGGAYADSNASFARLAEASCSFATLRRRLRDAGDDRSIADVREIIHAGTGITLADDEAAAVHAAAAGTGPTDLLRQHRNFAGTLGQALANHHGVGWTGVSHTADYVLLTACGPGRELFSGLLRNTDAFGRLTALLGIEHANPAFTPEEAARSMAPPTHVEVISERA